MTVKILREVKKNTKSDWHKMKDTVTVYHGTSDIYLNDIKKYGLIPPTPQQIVDDTIREAGFDPSEVPNYVKGEIRYRRDAPFLFTSTSYQTAENYSDPTGGEIRTSTYYWLKRWAEKTHKKRRLKPFRTGRPIVVKIEVPVDRVFTHHTPIKERFQEVADNFKRSGMKLEPDEVGFELMSKLPIPNEYVKGIIYPDSPSRVSGWMSKK